MADAAPATPLTTAAVLGACPTGAATGAYARRLARSLAADQAIPQAEWLRVWTTDLLLAHVREHTDGIWVWSDTGNWFALSNLIHDRSNGPPVMAVTDRRYVSVPGVPGVFDLAEAVPAVAAGRWLVAWMYNLRETFDVCAARAAEWPTTEKPPASGSTPTPSPRPC